MVCSQWPRSNKAHSGPSFRGGRLERGGAAGPTELPRGRKGGHDPRAGSSPHPTTPDCLSFSSVLSESPSLCSEELLAVTEQR